MSNNDTELFNLCKAVYEATGWSCWYESLGQQILRWNI